MIYVHKTRIALDGACTIDENTIYNYKATKIQQLAVSRQPFLVTPEIIYNYYATCTAHFLPNSVSKSQTQ